MGAKITTFIFAFVAFFFAFFSLEQYQQTTHISGSDHLTFRDVQGCSSEIFGETNKYSRGNTIGGRAGATSHRIGEEILVFFGRIISESCLSDQVWKYSTKVNQWKFVRGRKRNMNVFAEYTEFNSFNPNNNISGKAYAKGWIDKNSIITIFGGMSFHKLGDEKTTYVYPTNELWRYNVSSNMFAVINHSIQKTDLYSKLNYPGGRKYHSLVQIDEDRVFLHGGRGFFLGTISTSCNDYGGCFLSCYWMYSISVNKWTHLGGSLSNTDAIQLGNTNVYDDSNSIGGICFLSTVLLNPEEIFVFGGTTNPLLQDNTFNLISKYNITSNQWKKIYGQTTKTFGSGYLRDFHINNTIGSRYGHQIWKIGEDEILVFGGKGYGLFKVGLLNDEMIFNTNKNLWKFTGKEDTKWPDRYSFYSSSSNSYSEDTMIGGIKDFVGEYYPEKQELIICTGEGYSKLQKRILDDCWSIYHGIMCHGLKVDDPEVCSKKGKCISHNFCQCNDGFFGDNCEITQCEGTFSNNSEVCSKNGICMMNSKCLCFDQFFYTEPDCSQNELLKNLWLIITITVGTIVVAVALILLFVFFICIIFNQKKKLVKLDKIEDVDLILEEQKLSRDTSKAHFKINKGLFEINPKDINIIEKIGEGGGSGIVYKAQWESQVVAYKCFQVQEFLEENKFKEFEKEVEILASISFPFILTFFGATLTTQRLGFVMELAENGDLEHFLKDFKKKNNGKSYSITKKLRMMYQLSSAMLFLHNKKILHRDLKPMNVLVTENEEIKVMDFGLSKIVDSDLTKTKQVGTSFYIAPEVLSGRYSFSCDVFSFAMLMFVVFSENFKPFSGFGIETKIKSDPNLRPDLNQLRKLKIQNQLILLIEENWKHNEAERMNFKMITEKLEKMVDRKIGEIPRRKIYQANHENIGTRTESNNIIGKLKEEIKKRDQEILRLRRIVKSQSTKK